MLITGAALICRCNWLCLPAAMTATLLVIDAWFDVTTSAPGSALATAVAMAAFAELPAASLCAVLAMRNIRTLSRQAAADLRPSYSTSSRMRSIRSSLSRSSLT